ncbi:MAG: hypothetical protein ABIV11_02180 [Gemmatimonadaceae bacterium]
MGAAASVELHLGIVFFAVVATANARSSALEKSREEKLHYVEVKKEEVKKEEPKKEEPKPEEPTPVKKAATPPRTPEAPRVVVQSVVSANGRVEPGSIKMLESTNSAFAAAVREVLPSHRFSPAKIGGTA